MLFYLAFFILMLAALLTVTLAGKDFFPFSHYPMFSAPHQLNRVKVYRIALETHDGKIEWWQHEAYRYPEFIGRKLKSLYTNATSTIDNKTVLLATLEKRRLLCEVLRLLELGGDQAAKYRSFRIIERTVNDQFEIIDKEIDAFKFDKLRGGKNS
jgi:hypothetical protein